MDHFLLLREETKNIFIETVLTTIDELINRDFFGYFTFFSFVT